MHKYISGEFVAVNGNPLNTSIDLFINQFAKQPYDSDGHENAFLTEVVSIVPIGIRIIVTLKVWFPLSK